MTEPSGREAPDAGRTTGKTMTDIEKFQRDIDGLKAEKNYPPTSPRRSTTTKAPAGASPLKQIEVFTAKS